MNIKFCYLYRDSANYKQYNQIVFSNANHVNIGMIRKIIKQNLIDGEWFIASNLNLPDLQPKNYLWDSQIDHEWHEFESVAETYDEVTNESSIDVFLSLLQSKR